MPSPVSPAWLNSPVALLPPVWLKPLNPLKATLAVAVVAATVAGCSSDPSLRQPSPASAASAAGPTGSTVMPAQATTAGPTLATTPMAPPATAEPMPRTAPSPAATAADPSSSAATPLPPMATGSMTNPATDSSPPPPPDPYPGTQRRVEFRCATGEELEMRFFPVQGVAVLVRNGQSQELQQVPSGSGFRYEGAGYLAIGKGRELRIEQAGAEPLDCIGTGVQIDGRPPR